MTITPEVRAALTAGRLAHLTTLNPDGSPQTTIIWIGVDGDEIVSGHMAMTKKLRNVQQDPRVSISLELDGRNAMGLDHYLVIEGTAEVTDGGAHALLRRLAKVYLGPDADFLPMADPPPGFVLRTTPKKVRGVTPWAEA
ncbi:MAG: PPOX class F420-dependent oxidoreductase [Actinomycetota bacterium]|nr:PPOX class F420-dependent oxidoreductase [Actinomycetota bacterium]